MEKLSMEQLKIIKNNANNILVISGAGCGKTFTITHKIKYLLANNFQEKEILCISFTNDSVCNLKKRLNNLNIFNVDVYTFHKLSLEILKHYQKTFFIADDNLLTYLIDEFFLSDFDNNKNLKNIILYLTKNKKLENNYLKKDIYNYIKNIKCQNMKMENIYESKNKKIRYFKALCLYLFIKYENELRSQNLIDFEDMIIKATEIINKKYKEYKYIIIDEFQDTSLIRLNLIKKINKYNKTKMMFVGDDYQSIYKFSGCNLDIFINLNKYIDNLKIMYLSTTYRFSKQLASVSNQFILKNKMQIKKNICSIKENKHPIKIVYYKKESDLFKLIKKINKDILILGRNNKDILKYFQPEKSGYINDHLRYLTIHKAKGLEEEEIIIINLENKKLGFPSKIKNNYTKIDSDEIKYAEERRLFYVALTRTKNNVYLFCQKKNTSVFVKEIKKQYKNYIEFIKF